MPKSSTSSSKTRLLDGVRKAPSVVVGELGTDQGDIRPERRSEVNPAKTPADDFRRRRSSPRAASPGDLGEHCPDDGIRAWLVVFGCWLALFASSAS
jgi:hypothetical protein